MTMLLAIFGATGKQGGSVVNHILNDPELSSKFRLRAITRNVDSPKAQELKSRGIDVVAGNASDRPSLEAALTGVDAAFVMTTPVFADDAVEAEFGHGKQVADVLVAKGCHYIIFSTLPSVSDISGGRYTSVTPFDAKAKIQRYIESLPVQSAFVAGGWFMQNWEEQPWNAPKRAADNDGTWVLSRPNPAETLWPFVDCVADFGKFVGAILAEPAKYAGKTFNAASGCYSGTELCAILSKTSGVTVVYKEVSVEEYKASVPPFMADMFADGFRYQAECGGLFGPGTVESVGWAQQAVRGKLTTLEEFLEDHPLKLE